MSYTVTNCRLIVGGLEIKDVTTVSIPSPQRQIKKYDASRNRLPKIQLLNVYEPMEVTWLVESSPWELNLLLSKVDPVKIVCEGNLHSRDGTNNIASFTMHGIITEYAFAKTYIALITDFKLTIDGKVIEEISNSDSFDSEISKL